MTTIIEERAVHLPDAEATQDAGVRMAPHLAGGMIVTLSGELGAGKTTLVRGMLRGLGWKGPVKSPSYALVEDYAFSSLYFYHFDFYRFGKSDNWDSSGFSEYFRSAAVVVIEWPERVAARLPWVDLGLALAPSGAGRSLRATAWTPAGSACLAAFGPAAQ